jgi:hypothetical protein
MTRRSTTSIIAIVVVALIAAKQLAAQRAAPNADSLLARGSVARAESLYYADARNHPRDPGARWSLGTYLIGRGASRIGMTLVEEAVQFGFDKQRAGRLLAPIYLDLGEYRKLLALPAPSLSAGERERARYLDAHPSRVIASDSMVLAAFVPDSSRATIGSISIRVDGRPVQATIINSGPELALATGSAAASSVHTFAGRAVAGENDAPTVADSVGISRLVATNVPVTVTVMTLPPGIEARVSLAFLARYAPTFDARAKLITLRPSGSVGLASVRGNTFVTLETSGRFSLVKAGGWVPVDDAAMVQLLGDRAWTLDAKRGTIVVAR